MHGPGISALRASPAHASRGVGAAPSTDATSARAGALITGAATELSRVESERTKAGQPFGIDERAALCFGKMTEVARVANGLQGDRRAAYLSQVSDSLGKLTDPGTRGQLRAHLLVTLDAKCLGDYQPVLDHALHDKESVGWMSTCMLVQPRTLAPAFGQMRAAVARKAWPDF
jgi:hypothetical protein